MADVAGVDLKKLSDQLAEYIRPQSFPVAIKMLREGEPLPDKVRIPSRDFGKQFATCQAISLVRRYGWTLALTKEDMQCSLGVLALGFEKPPKLYQDGYMCDGMYTATPEAGKVSEEQVPRFAPGQYHTILMAALDRAPFVPDLVVIYANSAQVMRLLQGRLWKTGGRLTSSFQGRIDCADVVVQTMQTDECQVVLPCSGDRIFAQTQDHEMAFTIPFSKLVDVVQGLEGTHKGGIRYPVTSFMDYEPKLPPKYTALSDMWDARDGKMKFTGRDRVRAAYRRTYADRVPYYPILGATAAVFAGISVTDYLKDPKQLARAQLEMYERLPRDIVVMMTDLVKEPEVMGSKIRWEEGEITAVEVPVLDEDKGKLARFQVPSVTSAGRLPWFFEGCERVAKAVKDAAVGAVVTGPWAIAAGLRGVEKIILDTFDDPPFVHDLMKFSMELAKAIGDATQATGAGLSFSEPTSSCSLVSPEVYREFIKPYHVDLMNYYKTKKAGVTLHMCGFVEPIVEDIIEAGIAGLSIDNYSNLADVVKLARKRIVLIGNVDTNLFISGTREDMERAVKQCIDIAAEGSAFVLASGCDLPLNTKWENLMWFMEAAERYGRYTEAPVA